MRRHPDHPYIAKIRDGLGASEDDNVLHRFTERFIHLDGNERRADLNRLDTACESHWGNTELRQDVQLQDFRRRLRAIDGRLRGIGFD